MNLEIFELDELLALSMIDMKNQSYQAALEKVKFIRAHESFPAAVLALAGKLYATLGLFERARESFSEYLVREPEAYLELFQLGMVEKDLGNYGVAIELWTRVLEINRNYPEALFYLGDLCIRLDRIEEARTWLLTLLETAPDESEFIPLADQLLNRIKGH
jgi:tetratricopeptide (TPR) repeat protein